MFRVVAVMYLLNLPNTVFVSVVAALSILRLQRRRQILYATLLWPLYLHMAYWLQVGVLKLGALRLGLPTDIERLPVPLGFRYTAVLVLVTVGTFLLVVLLLDRLLTRRRHGPPLMIEAQD